MKETQMTGTRKDPAEQGFSLIELIIAMVLFLIVSGAIFGLLQVASRSRTVVNENTGMGKNLRVALNLLGRDTYNAGYGYPLTNTVVLPDNRVATLLSIPGDPDTSRDTIPPIIAGDNVRLNNYNPTPNTRTDQVTFLFKDNTFNVVSGVSQSLPVNAATTTSSIDEIIPVSGSTAACRVNDIYLISGSNGATLGVATGLSGGNKILFANGDVLGFNLTGTSGPLRSITTPASIQRVLMTTYYVTTDGTLMRREYANRPSGAFVDEPLVYGVEDFQIVYILDNGTSSNNPSAGPNGIAGDSDDTPGNLMAVRQIRFTVSVRSLELKQDGQPYRASQSATFSTRNLGYDAY